MSKYEISYVSKRVQKELESLNEADRREVEEAIQMLSNNPRPAKLEFGTVHRCNSVKKIKVKRIRILFLLDEKNRIIHIGKIMNRDSKSYTYDPSAWFRTVS